MKTLKCVEFVRVNKDEKNEMPLSNHGLETPEGCKRNQINDKFI